MSSDDSIDAERKKERTREIKRRSQAKRQPWKQEAAKKWREENLEKCRGYLRAYQERNREVLRERARAYREKYPERVKASRKKSRAKQSDWFKSHYRKQKSSVLQAYGGRCACCGEENECFLTIDHVANDGAVHRRERKKDGGGEYHGNGYAIYRYLIKQGYPQDGRFQVLCYNCNCCKQHDPVGHRKAHPNAVNIDGLGELEAKKNADGEAEEKVSEEANGTDCSAVG